MFLLFSGTMLTAVSGSGSLSCPSPAKTALFAGSKVSFSLLEARSGIIWGWGELFFAGSRLSYTLLEVRSAFVLCLLTKVRNYPLTARCAIIFVFAGSKVSYNLLKEWWDELSFAWSRMTNIFAGREVGYYLLDARSVIVAGSITS